MPLTKGIGLLTMGGSAERWNGHYKEFLPVGTNRWMCDHALDALRTVGVHRVLIVSRPDKITMHTQHFAKEKYKDLDIAYVMTKGDQLWDGFRAALPILLGEKRVMFAMPDTMIEPKAFTGYSPEAAISFGTFHTQMPEKFSVLYNGAIICKDPSLAGTEQRAWGVITWNAEITALMYNIYGNQRVPYDNVFNSMMQQQRTDIYDIGSYADIASWRDYRVQFDSTL